MKYRLVQNADWKIQTGYKITRTRYKTQTVDYGLGIKYGLQTMLVKTVQIQVQVGKKN